MTRDRLDELFAHCADLGVDVEWADLGSKVRGGYDPKRDIIILSPRLTVAQCASTLGHEIGHQAFGDRCSTPAVERRAWEYAAALLVTPVEYERAEESVGSHLGALARELEVTPKLIEAWQRWWAKRGRDLHDRGAL